MEKEMGLLWEVTAGEFVLVTVLIGGLLATAIGRSTARSWSGWGLLVFYTLLLTVAIRFIHYALFRGTFSLQSGGLATALHYALVDFVVLLACAVAGRLLTRSRQVARQYGFLQR